MTKIQRPGLGTRKSTQSVTTEQRLRELAIVSTMLHAAMGDSGDEEVKEEYGQQVDMGMLHRYRAKAYPSADLLTELQI